MDSNETSAKLGETFAVIGNREGIAVAIDSNLPLLFLVFGSIEDIYRTDKSIQAKSGSASTSYNCSRSLILESIAESKRQPSNQRESDRLSTQ